MRNVSLKIDGALQIFLCRQDFYNTCKSAILFRSQRPSWWLGSIIAQGMAAPIFQGRLDDCDILSNIRDLQSACEWGRQ